ncbi:MAG: transglutaminase family protein [Dehalococcoidia bacterium]|nr:transglutaminase family protein [Dehalococcoidia bacterium]
MASELELYLKPSELINADNEAIQETAKRLTLGCTCDEERISRLFYFVRDTIKYSVYMISTHPDDFKASTTLARGKGYCVQKAVLLTALGRAAGVPSRLVFAKIRNHRTPAHLMERTGTDVFPGHGYNQFYLHGEWINATATFDRELCLRMGFPMVEFDGTRHATLPTTDLKGNPFIEYLEVYPPRADVPLEWIAERVSLIWGANKRAWLNKENSSSHFESNGL